jgi:hypothetical protein
MPWLAASLRVSNVMFLVWSFNQPADMLQCARDLAQNEITSLAATRIHHVEIPDSSRVAK